MKRLSRLDALQMLEAVIAKMNELGPYRMAALRHWIEDTYYVRPQAARAWIKQAKARLRQLSGKTAEQHTARYLAVLDSAIYHQDTSNRDRISAIDKACLLLGLYRQQQQTPHYTPWERLTQTNLNEAIAQDLDAPTPRSDGDAGQVPDHAPPTPRPELHPQNPDDPGAGKRHP